MSIHEDNFGKPRALLEIKQPPPLTAARLDPGFIHIVLPLAIHPRLSISATTYLLVETKWESSNFLAKHHPLSDREHVKFLVMGKNNGSCNHLTGMFHHLIDGMDFKELPFHASNLTCSSAHLYWVLMPIDWENTHPKCFLLALFMLMSNNWLHLLSTMVPLPAIEEMILPWNVLA